MKKGIVFIFILLNFFFVDKVFALSQSDVLNAQNNGRLLRSYNNIKINQPVDSEYSFGLGIGIKNANANNGYSGVNPITDDDKKQLQNAVLDGISHNIYTDCNMVIKGAKPSLAQNVENKYSIRYKNVGTYNSHSIDVKATVIAYDVSQHTENFHFRNSVLYLDKEKISNCNAGINSVTIKFEFIDSNTGKAVNGIKGYTTYWDVDFHQGVILENQNVGMYILEGNRLNYSTINGKTYVYAKDSKPADTKKTPEASFTEIFDTGSGNSITRTYTYGDPSTWNSFSGGITNDNEPIVRNYDYSLDAACVNCNSSMSSSKAYVVQDINDWNAILASDSVAGSNKGSACTTLGKYFKQGNSDIYCREEYHVYFPNKKNKISIQSGRFFTVNASLEQIAHLPIDIPDFKPIKVTKIRQCKSKSGDRSSLDAFDKNNSLVGTDLGSISIKYNNQNKYKYDDVLEKNKNYDYSHGVSNDLLTQSITYSYTLKDGVFRYVNKATGKAVHAKEVSDEDKKNYTDLGVSGFPISFSDDANASITFIYQLSSRMNLVYNKGSNNGLNCLNQAGDNIYKKISSISDEEKKQTSCFKLFNSLTSSSFKECVADRLNNKIGKCFQNEYSCSLNDRCSSESDAKSLGRDWNSKSGECCQVGYSYNSESGSCEPSGKCRIISGQYYIGDTQVDKSDYDKYCDFDKCEGDNIDLCPDGTCGRYVNGTLICSNSIKGNLFDSVIYRVIGLDNPFVGKEGNVRKTGNNWCGYDVISKSFSCDSKNSVVKAIFFDSNQVKNVYKDDHILYKVVLDGSSIDRIRNYNKGSSYDDWKLWCLEDDNSVCFSKFLKETSYFKDSKIEGKCALNKNSNAFYTCGD